MDAYPDTINEAIGIMNNYCAAPAVGTSDRHTPLTYSGVQFEQGKGPSAVELCAIQPVAGSNG